MNELDKLGLNVETIREMEKQLSNTSILAPKKNRDEKLGDLNLTVTVLEPSSGREVTYQDTFPYWDLIDGKPNHSTLRYIWEDGNYSCACNRKIFFYRALGLELPDEDTPCGYSQLYPVKLVLEDGTIVLDELENKEETNV